MRILDNLIYRADKLNEARIQYKLGIIYLEGDRVEPNLDEAKRWLERAADQGHEEAARALEGLEGKPKELQVQMGDDDLQVEDYDEGTPPIIEAEPRELPVDFGDETFGPPVISKPEMTVEEIGRKLGSQLKGMFGKTPGASSHPGESGEEEKKNPGCGATAWVVGVVLYVLARSCS
jgi:hypothetical protein